MFNPAFFYSTPHPSELLKDQMLLYKVNAAELARAMGLNGNGRINISKILNKTQRITPIMALRLAAVFNTTPTLWMNAQSNHDLKTTYDRIYEQLGEIQPLKLVPSHEFPTFDDPMEETFEPVVSKPTKGQMKELVRK